MATTGVVVTRDDGGGTVQYARLFRALAAEYLDMCNPAGGFAKGFWKSTWEGLLAQDDVFVSNDPTKVEDEAPG